MVPAPRTTFVTERQAAVHALFRLHRSMSAVARMMDVSQITIRETLVQYERNLLRDRGIRPPPLKEMLKGDVAPRFGVSRTESGGRPAKHGQTQPLASPTSIEHMRAARRSVTPSIGSITRLIVTTAQAGATLHTAFWQNLTAFADEIGAEVVVLRCGGNEPVHTGRGGNDLAAHFEKRAIDVGREVEIATDVSVPVRATRPLNAMQVRGTVVWTIVGHPVIQLETMPRIRADGLRVQMTTGAVTIPRHGSAASERDELGAVLVEIGIDGIAHCRHLLAPVAGDGSFQDLTVRVSGGLVARGCRVEALNFGDIHFANIDPAVARATWGIDAPLGEISLVDRLRPVTQVFHDVLDFDARNPFDTRDHHKRFAQMSIGRGDVRAEVEGTAKFLGATKREWSECLVVASNHDQMLTRWLRESDFREDPQNALFFLERSLELHRRLRRGEDTDGFFEETMRVSSPERLQGVKFLTDGESHRIHGVEVAIHGHKSVDGKPGGMQALERLGLRATIGHTHRPTTRGGLYSTGVCCADLDYARGPLTAWAVAHVVTYRGGARQHLFYHGARFHS